MDTLKAPLFPTEYCKMVSEQQLDYTTPYCLQCTGGHEPCECGKYDYDEGGQAEQAPEEALAPAERYLLRQFGCRSRVALCKKLGIDWAQLDTITAAMESYKAMQCSGENSEAEEYDYEYHEDEEDECMHSCTEFEDDGVEVCVDCGYMFR